MNTRKQHIDESQVDPRDRSPDGRTRKIPPLVWIIGLLLLAMVAWGALSRGPTHVTPSGGTMPQQAQERYDTDDVMPQNTAPSVVDDDLGRSGAAPATAPATTP